MFWWWVWPLLLLLAINADAELYLLKHGGNLYCASDDEDTPALAWNHNLNDGNAPRESVYWSKSANYSAINCKPEFGNKKCGDWNIGGWKLVNSYEKDLPPVLDFRWNDLKRFVVPKGNITRNRVLNPPATPLYLPVSLLVRDNAIIILRNQGWDWRIVIDGWVTSDIRTEVEWWRSNSTIKDLGFICVNCDGSVLNDGTRWITFTLKYEAQRKGDILKLLNHQNGRENVWTTNQTLTSVEDLHFYTYYDSYGLFGHWRFHLYNILEPTTNTGPMTLQFVANEGNQLCISVTYIAPDVYLLNTGAYIKLSHREKEINRKELFFTDNQWKTVKHVFSVTPGKGYVLRIYPPNTMFQGFAIGEIRACSEGEFRVSEIKSNAASECTKLKQNKVSPNTGITYNQDQTHKSLFSTPKNNLLCLGIIPNVKDCRSVIVCSSTACTCAPGYRGRYCEQACTAGWYGIGCSQQCSPNCSNNCHHVTGECINGCVDGWRGAYCSTPVCADKKKYGPNCSQKCSVNCIDDGSCHRDTGSCTHGCVENWTGDKCDQSRPQIQSNAGESNRDEDENADGSDGKINTNTAGNMKVNNNGNEPDYIGWLLLIPITLTICVVMYWRRKAIRKRFREFRLRSQGATTNEASSINMLPRNPTRASTSTSPVISPPVQLDVPPPVQPRLNVPGQLDVPPPLMPRQSSVPPAQEKPSLLVPLFDLANYIQNAVVSGQLAAQHATFPRGLTAPTIEAERKEHAGKNRWRNVLPYDFSRVVLDTLPRKPHSHYINASYIDGYMKEKAFIATQGPRAETVDDFWRLVWQKNVSCIIMLCNLTEGQTMKCEKYWPAVGSSAHHRDELQVRTDSEDAFLDHVVRILSVSRGKNGASRIITQLHYTAWPDHGVPRYAHSLASVLRQVPLDGDAPILVHCSAGVGRTGTVILALAGYVMGQAEGVVDMLALLAKMRSQRPNMVDNATQYETAHRVLLEMNTLPGSEMPVKNFHAAYRSLQGQETLQTQFWDLSEACRRDILDSSELGWPKEKNRIPDIVPGTEGRVILECAVCSYINAVYVDGLRSRDRYIVTQLPLPNTLADFWLMVWQREVKMVVVLNKPEPNFYLNHVTLWSEGGELQLAESLKVRHVGTTENAIFYLHRVVLKHQFPNRSEANREVSVLSVNQWRVGELTPHHTDTLVRLWSEMEKIPGTVVLACHDGATASGLTVSAALMLEHLHATSFVDVASAVRRARRTRPKFITSLTQYEFLHTVALAEVESMDAYVNL